MSKKTVAYVTRFSPRQRVEHLTIMLLFLVLALTGLPQKFYGSPWSQWLIVHLGGIDCVHWIHRVCGIVFTIGAVEHFGVIIVGVLLRRLDFSMVPTKKDFRDAIVMLRYYLGVSDERARFDRYDYRQKFEYWGLVFGGLIMIVTGFILYFPILVTSVLPGELIPAAKVAHSNEGLLAFLIVIIWHIYNAHLSPEVFPFDPSIFTGKVPAERARHEHPLEYERLAAKGEAPGEAAETGGESP